MGVVAAVSGYASEGPVEVKSGRVRSHCFGAAAVVTEDYSMNEVLPRVRMSSQ